MWSIIGRVSSVNNELIDVRKTIKNMGNMIAKHDNATSNKNIMVSD